jgi:hypothetical protein
MRCNSLLLAVGLCVINLAKALGQVPDGGTIVPGKSVAGISLGATRDSFERSFPKKDGTDEDLPTNGCGIDGYHWVDVDRGATGVYAYTKDGGIVQLSVKTPRFSLADGLKMDATQAAVERAYPHGSGYELLHSNSAVMGGKDLIYWVDEKAGIAFELYWNRKSSRRLVSGIDIFKPGAAYKPEGCISAPQSWRAVK